MGIAFQTCIAPTVHQTVNFRDHETDIQILPMLSKMTNTSIDIQAGVHVLYTLNITILFINHHKSH